MRRMLLALLLPVLALATPAAAQDAWPVRPLTIMSGFPNGSGIDIYARLLTEPLSRALDVPTMELACALPGFESTTWYGLFFPARTPDALVRRLNQAVVAIVRDPEFSAKLVAQGVTPLTSTPEEMRAVQIADIAKWREIVQRSGARAE